jgi:PAS domain S-box-containing protein
MTDESHDDAARLAAELEEARRRIAELEATAALAAECRALIQNLSDGFALLDASGVHVEVNPALCAMTGFGRGELVGAGPPYPYWPPEEHATIEAALGQTLAGTPRTFPLTFMRKDGTRFPVLVSPSVLTGPDGAVVSVFATVKDMTALTKAEAEIAESERRYRLLLQNLNDAVYVHAATATDPGVFLDVNDRACELLGYTREELLSMCVPAIDVPEQAGRLPAIMKRLHESGSAIFATEHLAKDGRRIPVEVSTRLFDLQGRLVVLSVVRDISERVAAEAAVAKARELLDETQEISKVGGWEHDVATGRFTWTDETYRIHGVARDFDVNRLERNVAFYSPEDQTVISKAFRDVLESGIPYEKELEFRPADGRHLWVRTSARAVMQDGVVTRVVGNIMDITERRRAEEEIRRLNAELAERVERRTEQLDAATRELEAFAYSISHDVRAPVRAIDGFSAMLVEDAGDRLTEADLEHLGRVREAARRLGQLIDDLLGLSRVSRRDMRRERCDLSALAARVGEELRAEHPHRTVELTVQPGLSADADPALARSILRELLDNAWKFTGRRETAHVEVGALDADGERAFYVRDDGVGFDMRHAGHLFGAFQRMHAAGEFEGDGIGLATVQRLVRRHGGRVWAEAEVDEGAAFFFTLPNNAGSGLEADDGD